MEKDLSIPGAREERAKLKLFQEILNREDIVPEQSYRMSKVSYSLVCFVNNISCLYLSKNYEVIPIFISRAQQHMNEFPATAAMQTYYDLVSIYLRQMAYVLKKFTSVTAESLSFVPDEILEAGKQKPPSSVGT